MALCVLLAGNPVDGMRVIGPFKQEHYASEWADEWLPDLDWWVAPLDSEKDYENEGNLPEGVAVR